MTPSTPDVVIVGAGSAGCVLAARLSERPSRSVLLLDAGDDPKPVPRELVDAATLPGAGYRWVRRYDARVSGDRTVEISSGRVVGGGSAVNGAYFIRGTPSDFDGWAAAGNDLWSYDSVLADFVRLERDLDLGAGPLHGADGPIPVTRDPGRSLPLITETFFDSCRAAGHVEEPDKNAGGPPGYGVVPRNVIDGTRVSTANAYLDPSRERPNLDVRSGVDVRRVVVEGGRAVGVEVSGADGSTSFVAAGRVVLCAGAVGSAQLLLVSGIGPASQLRSAGVDVVLDSPGVGSSTSDHPSIDLLYSPVDTADAGVSFLHGALHVDLAIAGSTRSAPVEILATRRSYGRASGDAPDDDLLGLRLSLMQPAVRGSVTLSSADPSSDPAIDLGHEHHEFDRAALRALVRHGVELLESRQFRPLVARRSGPGSEDLADDRRLDRWTAEHLTTSMHQSGSAPMGPATNPASVVDQRCAVHGIEALSVVDTSIMPVVTSRGPAATAVMIGEHAAGFFD